MKKKKISFTDKIKLPALNIISSLLASVIFKILIEPYIDIIGFLKKIRLNNIYHIVIPIFVVSAALIALAFFLLFRKNIEKKLKTVFPPILFACGILLIIINLNITCPHNQTLPQIIDSQKIDIDLLLEKNTIDIPVREQYSGLIIFIRYQEAEGEVIYLPELELEKINPLTGDWEILVPGDSTEKLVIVGLEKSKDNELYYHPQNGEFTVLNIEGKEVNLNTENKIRINFRNYAGFDRTIELIFYGIKTQGEKK